MKKSKDSLHWSLYKRLPNTLKRKIRDEQKDSIASGLSGGLLSDASFVFKCAIEGADLFDSIIGAAVLVTTDNGIEIKGTVVVVDTDKGTVEIEPFDVQINVTSFRFDQLTFLTDGFKPADPEVLSFNEAWGHYESGRPITSLHSLVTYNPTNEANRSFTLIEIRGGWMVVPTVLEREEYIQILMDADDDVVARFTGKSIESLKRLESEGTFSDLLASVYDSKTIEELRAFEIEWF